MIRLAWRLLRRELRSGELRLLFFALLIAIAALTAVSFFADRIRQALDREALQLIGGDLVLISDQAWPVSVYEEAARRGLAVATTRLFPSMVSGPQGPQLAEIKAVSSSYPLRGQLSVADRVGVAGQPVQGGPSPGEVWLDERLATALAVLPGEWVNVGRSRLRISAILTQEPDRSLNFFALAPRLLMHEDDLGASALIQVGARVSYRMLLAGEATPVLAFRTWLEAGHLGRGQRIEDVRNARPEVRSALERAQRFLGLASLLTMVLSAVSIALAARRYLQRHLDGCALMRCFGFTERQLLVMHGVQFLWLTVLAVLAGTLLGFAAHFGLVFWLGDALSITLPWPGGRPVLQGAVAGGVLLFGFAFPPLLQLSRVPTLRVLRRELGPPSPWLLGGYGVGLMLFVGLMLWVAGDPRLGALAAMGFAVALGAFWGVARLMVMLLGRLRTGGGFGWRQGLANLSRHGTASSVQIVAVAVGLMAMLLLTVTRSQLIDAWQHAVPADAPNRFIINVQPEQRPGVQAHLSAAGIDAELLPMVRARLVRIDGEPVSAERYPQDERAQRLVEREFNLSWRADLPPGNRTRAGHWFAPEDAARGVASVEEGLAQTLGIRLGATLSFMVGGEERTVTVTHLRQLEWGSMRVNFFVLTPPGVLDDAPASYITSIHVSPAQAGAIDALLAVYPNLTVIDVGVVLAQFQEVLKQVVGAVQFVFVFTLLAGAVVLYSALVSAFDERRYELAILRALGASRLQLRRALVVELAAIGAAGGLLAAVGAGLLGDQIARQVFDLRLGVAPWVVLLSSVLGAGFSTLVGAFAMRRLLDTPPLAALRAGA